MRGILLLFSVCILGYSTHVFGQTTGLVNTSGSPYAKLSSVNMDDVQWTEGFWGDRFEVCKESMVPNIWDIYNDPKVSHAFRNFEIAAGLAEGTHSGPSFHDGDFYKVLEAMAATYAVTRDPEIDREMDRAIKVIAMCQEDNGYIYTPALIQKRNNEGTGAAFQDKINFETYNLGHLMTAACVHFRATGKRSLLKVARKAADFLSNYYKEASPELARNAICPSHYMGIVEMYRVTRDPKYLDLAKNLIDIRGLTDEGTDDNQDRIPFREMTKTLGHAVRANYLFAGVADVYAETGDKTLLNTLDLMWNDVVKRKMYITGGCGSLYDGVSPDGTSYNPKEVQKVHQAYGRDYQLPNLTAHSETCANIGNVLWNWRMLLLTGEARYADVMELALHNSVLSGISLDGKGFLYTNPLAFSDDLPFQQRWSKERVPYIGLSNCCPPNVVRTMAEVSNYAYSLSDEGLWFNLYGGNKLSTTTKDGERLQLTQTTSYPWDGNITVRLDKVPAKSFSLFMRIPGWSDDAKIRINGKSISQTPTPGEYIELKDTWSAGDVIELVLPMSASLIEANPLVEANRNQVAVKRGPVVYCLESIDLPAGKDMFNVGIPADIKLQPDPVKIEGSNIISLVGQAKLYKNKAWENQLYREISQESSPVNIRLVPYYAWGNRGHSEMAVWLPLSR